MTGVVEERVWGKEAHQRGQTGGQGRCPEGIKVRHEEERPASRAWTRHLGKRPSGPCDICLRNMDGNEWGPK